MGAYDGLVSALTLLVRDIAFTAVELTAIGIVAAVLLGRARPGYVPPAPSPRRPAPVGVGSAGIAAPAPPRRTGGHRLFAKAAVREWR